MTPRDASGTRTRILDIASELFATKGYVGTSIADIAGRLGTTKGAIYYHFNSKDAILDALVSQPVAALTKIAEEIDERTQVAPAEMLGTLIDLQARFPAAYLTVYGGDPALLQEFSHRYGLKEKTLRIVGALAGPDATSERVVSAQIAVAAVKEGTVAALEMGKGLLSEAMRDAVLKSALAALAAGDSAEPAELTTR